MNLEKRSGLLTQPYCMYILVNSGDLRIKFYLYCMRTCISFITVNTAIKEANTTLQHETLGSNDILAFFVVWFMTGILFYLALVKVQAVLSLPYRSIVTLTITCN